MYFNPSLKKLGLSNNDKVLILHADDVGVTQSSVEAFQELSSFGTVTCGSAIIPSSWFPYAAKAYYENPKLDLGIHLAFNCEFETYLWRPVSNISPDSGLVDEKGYFKQEAQGIMEAASPEAVAKELEYQIKLALNFGLKPSHADSHSLMLMAPQFIKSYMEICSSYNILPVLLNVYNDDAGDIKLKQMMSKYNAGIYVEKARSLEMPVVDNMSFIPLNELQNPVERLEAAKHIFDNLKPGTITHFSIHPLKDTPETRALKGSFQARISDYENFMKKEVLDYIKDNGIVLLSYRDIIKH